MNRSQAFQILELSNSASEDDIRKKYRELAKIYHPDNKKTGSEEKFKQITNAYETLSKKQESPHFNMPNMWNMNDFQHQEQSEIHLNITISFQESVLGATKEIKYSRQNKCPDCDGNGFIPLNNGCTHCNGSGRIINKQNFGVFISTCSHCHGNVQHKTCSQCHGAGTVEIELTLKVAIPPGVISSNILRLNNMGHYVGQFGPIEQYTDTLLHISVTPEEGLSLQGQDVISELNLTLNEAISGATKSVKTILGNQDINVPPLSKNKDHVVIPNLGVNKKGSHKVFLNIQYPSNIQDLLQQATY